MIYVTYNNYVNVNLPVTDLNSIVITLGLNTLTERRIFHDIALVYKLLSARIVGERKETELLYYILKKLAFFYYSFQRNAEKRL